MNLLVAQSTIREVAQAQSDTSARKPLTLSRGPFTMTLTEYRSGDEQSREDAPLLMDYSPERTISNSRNPLIHEIHSPRIIILVLCAIIFTLSFGGCLMIVPSLRLYEDIICHHYYESLEGEGHIGLDGHIKESLCKVDEVQNELNIFLAVFNFCLLYLVC
jgi:hypothetical protein